MILTKHLDLTPKEIRVVADVGLLFMQEIEAFTIAGFCTITGHIDNRHTRRAIGKLVKAGKLFKARQLFEDGHYRDMFSLQLTQPMKLVA